MPYNPGIQYRGDQYLYQGLSQGLQNIADGVKQYRSDKKESQAADAAFETFVKGAQPLLADGTVPPELAKDMEDAGKFGGLSLSQKKAKLGQLTTSVSMLLQNRAHKDTQANQTELANYRNKLLKLDQDAALARERTRSDTMGVLAGTADNEGDAAVYQQFPNADAQVVASHLDRQAQAEARKRPAWDGPGKPVDLGNGDRFIFTSPNSGQVIQHKSDTEKDVKLEVGMDAFGQPRYSFSGPPEKVAAKLKEMGYTMPSAAGAPAGQQFKKGDRARQNGITYEFDGKTWNPVR